MLLSALVRDTFSEVDDGQITENKWLLSSWTQKELPFEVQGTSWKRGRKNCESQKIGKGEVRSEGGWGNGPLSQMLTAKAWRSESGSNIHGTSRAWWHTPIDPELGGEDRRGTPGVCWLPASLMSQLQWETLFQNMRWRTVEKDNIHLSFLHTCTRTCTSTPPPQYIL